MTPGLARRDFLAAGGWALLGLLGRPAPQRPHRIAEVRMRSDVAGARVWFEPVGLLVEPGTVIRWIVEEGVHTTTAYHPANGDRPARIPLEAMPWDSGIMMRRGQVFEVKLERRGVYDYYCAPHELAGMVGRIVVHDGGAAPRGYDDSDARLPSGAGNAFPPIERILSERAVTVTRPEMNMPGGIQ